MADISTFADSVSVVTFGRDLTRFELTTAIEAGFRLGGANRVMWNLGSTLSTGLREADVYIIARRLAAATQSTTKRWLAIVASCDYIYATMRQLASYAEAQTHGLSIMVFRDQSRALAWVEQPEA